MVIRKKKTKSRYITGIYRPKKSQQKEIKYRSSWEFSCLQWLDIQEDVLEFIYEPFPILYLSNKKTGKYRKYYPDILIFYKDGINKLIEIKRKDKLNDLKVKKKLKAGEEYCKLHQMEFCVWTDEKIKEIQLLFPPPKKIKTGHKKKLKRRKLKKQTIK